MVSDSTREFQSTLPVRGATSENVVVLNNGLISIHAPRAGSDVADLLRAGYVEISIHAPRAGSDRLLPCNTQFRSYFNPRSPCGERRP